MSREPELSIQAQSFLEAYRRERAAVWARRRGAITSGSLFEAVRRALRKPFSARAATNPPGGEDAPR